MASTLAYVGFGVGGVIAGMVVGGAIGLTNPAVGPDDGVEDPPKQEEVKPPDLGHEEEPPKEEEPEPELESEQPGGEEEEEPAEGELPEQEEPGGEETLTVLVDGLYIANNEFTTVSGVQSETEPELAEDGTPGEHHFEPLVIERMHHGDDEFSEWRADVVKGDVVRRDLTVTLNDPMGLGLRAIKCEQGFPAEWELPMGGHEGEDQPKPEIITMSCERVHEFTP